MTTLSNSLAREEMKYEQVDGLMMKRTLESRIMKVFLQMNWAIFYIIFSFLLFVLPFSFPFSTSG